MQSKKKLEQTKTDKPARKRRYKFKIGALVTGIDRSFKRSVYKLIARSSQADIGLFEFQSLGRDVVERWKDGHASTASYQGYRRYNEFRLATKKELLESYKARSTYMLIKMLRRLRVSV